eukprot:TRINITY_DN1798_c0_g1_i3.p1 TRINITY_DN1798_c0_g1~~TRINITY_DN1798_c0_g1_i3.p1  ORF type:complete len:316 (-),score=34.54 TRINITY_DN1798_c0_g1_i3:40-933(-)
MEKRLANIMSSFASNEENTVALLGALAEEVEQRVQLLQSIDKKVGEAYQKIRTPVKMNIRGQLITTSVETLSFFKDTYFCGMVTRSPDTDGEYFIDRDPKHFHRILNFMYSHGKDPIFSGLSISGRKELRKELDYYSIVLPSPQYQDWRWSTDKRGAYIILDSSNRTATGTSGQIGGTVGDKEVDCFSVKIGCLGIAHIGFLLSTQPIAGYNQALWTYGWFLRLSDGRASFNGVIESSPFLIQIGDVIEFQCDRREGGISVLHNNDEKWFFSNVPATARVLPCFDSGSTCASVEIIH